MKKIYTAFLFLFILGFSAESQVVINEVYGGGGNSGATYKNDFIELYNNGSSAVNLTGWSVQYASSAGTNWAVTNLSGSIPANGYYLIQEIAGAGGTTNLPVADAIGTISMSGTAGKVALVNSITALTGACPAAAGLVDQVGFGTAANCFEGTGPTPAPSNINSVQRTPIGTDTQNNSADFTAGPPSPNNSGGPDATPPVVVTLSPANTSTSIATSFTANITFSESVIKGISGSIAIKKNADNSIVQTIDILASSVTIAGANIFFPVNSLELSTSYYIEISSGAFTDITGNSFTGITGSSAWSFTTAATVGSGTVGTTYNFNDCLTSLADGFTTYSVTGAEVWACTTFGRDPANPAGTTAFENAVQINGFSNGTNVVDVDWFISPSFDLSVTTYPLLSFWSRTAFNGAPLQLKVSTDYPGTGDPNAYTWTDINGRFPAQASNIWTLSPGINLTAYKSTHTYFAFVYFSTPEDGARWTLDDIRIDNSATPPAASLNTSTTDIRFSYVPVSTASVKRFTFTGNDLTGSVTLTATGNYLVSKTPNNFTGSIAYTQGEANNIPQTVYVQFSPTQTGLNYTGIIAVSTTGVPDASVNLSGNSIDAALTLEVVNWNLEWFGSSDPALGPSGKTQQEANIKTITQNIGADLFAFAEVVSETRLQNVVANLNAVYGAGTYSYVICNYGSHTNPFESGAGPLSEAQKEAFVYKTAVISPIGTPGAIIANGVNTAADLTNPAYNYFSSGRYPYMMNANVTLGAITKPVRFILIHAKANTSPTNTSYNRRKSGADTLNYTLNNLYPGDNIVLLGDFNDDLDQSITAGFTVSSYSTFNADAANFFSPTLALSLAGKKSTVSYNDMIDHVELSNEMQPYYMQNTAGVLTDVTSLVTNYGSTTTDHYPIFTRYAFDPIVLPVNLLSFTVVKQNNTAIINWSTSGELNSKIFVAERSTDNRYWTAVGTVNATGNSNSKKDYSLTDYAPGKGINYYRLKQIDVDGRIQYSMVRAVSFEKKSKINISPNPAKTFIKITAGDNNAGYLTIEIIDITGKVISRVTTPTSSLQIDISKYAKGTYFIKALNGKEVTIQKLLVQ
ncbi:MAG: lamin tail domain-containing protein [Ferruginibacter sp.]